MDPNATLRDIDDAVEDLHAALRTDAGRAAVGFALAQLAERASALDLWIVQGGFLPAAPVPAPVPAPETTHVWLAR